MPDQPHTDAMHEQIAGLFSSTEMPDANPEASGTMYAGRFSRFHRRVVRATDALFASKPWRGGVDEQEAKFRRWLEEASAAYGVPVPELAIVPPSQCAGSGCYYGRGDGVILLPKASVVTLFHEFRHHMQHQRARPMVSMDVEEDARAWSVSLFAMVRPRLYARAVRNGTLLYS